MSLYRKEIVLTMGIKCEKRENGLNATALVKKYCFGKSTIMDIKRKNYDISNCLQHISGNWKL